MVSFRKTFCIRTLVEKDARARGSGPSARVTSGLGSVKALCMGPYGGFYVILPLPNQWRRKLLTLQSSANAC